MKHQTANHRYSSKENPQRDSFCFPEIKIVDSTTIATTTNSSMQASRVEAMGNGSKTIVYRKLKRRKGNCTSFRMGSSLTTASSTQLISTLLFLLQCLGIWNHLPAATAYLNHPSSPKQQLSTKPIEKTSPPTKQRYAFLTNPKDKHFAATGTLPPLPPSIDILKHPFPPMTSNTDESYSSPLLHKIAPTPVSVTYTNDPKVVDEWLCQHVPYDGCFLGFDIERLPMTRVTSSSIHSSVDRQSFAHAAVVQLATLNSCLVVHLVDTSNLSPSHGYSEHQYHPKHSNECAKLLKMVLEDPSVIKAGCAIDEDLVFLHELWSNKNSGTKQHQQKASKIHNNSIMKTDLHQSFSYNNTNHQEIENHKTPTRTIRVAGVSSKKRSSNQQNLSTAAAAAFSRATSNRATTTRSSITTAHKSSSLRAKSRFDLGCVMLPLKPSTNLGDQNSINEHQQHPNRKQDKNYLFQHHSSDDYQIVAHWRETINNKSGLQGLCRAILGVDLPKDKIDSASDWTQFPLTDDQITYAARDAWAGVAIATKLASMNVKIMGGDDGNNGNDNFDIGASAAGETKNTKPIFSRDSLVEVLQKAETPLPQLAERHRQRKRAKVELRELLHPYVRNLFLNQQNLRRHNELLRQEEQLSSNEQPPKDKFQRRTMRRTHNTESSKNTSDQQPKINVEALFVNYPLSCRRTIADYAQRQQQLMEKSLPKRIRKQSMVLRQQVNAKVIDHRVIFEIDLVHPNQKTHSGDEDCDCDPTIAANPPGKRPKRHRPVNPPGKRSKRHRRSHGRSRKRRNSRASSRDDQ